MEDSADTPSTGRATSSPNLVECNFTASAPDRLWMADITYIQTWPGFLYLAVLIDAWSRRVVGWAMANHLKTGLVLEALHMALWQRRPEEVIYHSDRGCQYTSIAFGLRCREVGVKISMGSRGDCFDNALCERLFATLECELIDRRHSKIDYESPISYEGRRQSRVSFLFGSSWGHFRVCP